MDAEYCPKCGTRKVSVTTAEDEYGNEMGYTYCPNCSAHHVNRVMLLCGLVCVLAGMIGTIYQTVSHQPLFGVSDPGLSLILMCVGVILFLMTLIGTICR